MWSGTGGKVQKGNATAAAARRGRGELSRKRDRVGRADGGNGAGMLARNTLDGLSAHIAIINEKGTIEVVNAAWRRFAAANGGRGGKLAEGASYLAVCDGARGEDAATARAFGKAIRDVLAGRRRLFEAEYPCHSPGERRWFLGRVTRMPGGGPARVIAAHQDITSRREAEEALRASEENHRQLLSCMGTGMGYYDLQGRLRFLNHWAARVLGGAPEDFLGRSLRALYGASLGGLIKKRMERAARTDQVGVYEDMVALRGVKRWFLSNYSRVKDDAGRVAGVQIISSDITERKHAEESLRESEERYRHLVETCPDTIFVHRQDKIVLINQAGLELLGATRPQQVLGHSPFEFIHPDNHAEVKRRTAEFLAQRRTSSLGRRKFVRLDGEERIVDASVTPNTYMGKPALQVVLRDVTEQVHAEEALREQRHNMAHRSRVASIGELTTAIAHELNQPLGASLLYAETFRELMRKRNGSGGVPWEMMGKLIAELERARGIIGRIRDFTRKHTLTRTRVEVEPLLREAVLLLDQEFRLARVEVRYHVELGLPAVQGDRVFLQQVLVNLMMNALDAMAETSKRPRILTLSATRQGKGLCVIGVGDTGMGLAPAIADKVFEAFVTTRPRGLGLGLSLARTLIEEHGGRIWHEPAPGGGAVFRFSIPVTPTRETHHAERSGERTHRR